jgi:2-deoxy-D-gluconate 3-dehydrogenase
MGVLDRFRLDGKIALVTGCSRGLGRAMALALAEAGADIIGVSTTLSSSGSEVENQIVALGRKFKGYQADFATRTSLYSFIDKVRADFTAIDILVNNAGAIVRTPVADHPDEAWDRILETNLTSAFILSREIGKGMAELRSGKIIFIGSVLTFQGGILVPSYAASKGGIGQLVKAFANEWAGLGVHVNGIAPGYMVTDATREIKNDPERYQETLKRIPAGKWGTPVDLAGAVVFLASSAADYVHGEIITIDGGWMGR